MNQESFPGIPKVKTTPEIILEQEGSLENTNERKTLSPEELESRVSELADLSASRAEVAKHVNEAWGVKSKTELAELKAKGEETLAAHLEALQLDPELAEFQEGTLKEYDARIRELGSNPKVLRVYKEKFEEKKQTLARVLAYEHAEKELDAITRGRTETRRAVRESRPRPGSH